MRKKAFILGGYCERESLVCLASIGCQYHATVVNSCRGSDYKALNGSLDVYVFSRKSSWA